MRLIRIPEEKYEEYSRFLMFHCYKWDPCFEDSNTIAGYALVLTKEEHEQLARYTEKLDEETREAEEFLNHHLKYAGPLALPPSVRREIKKMKNYDKEKHIRLMRYDFHPTTDGNWAVSEVNSDVPGGFAEASFMPAAVLETLPEEKKEGISFIRFSDILLNAICQKVKPGGKIMLIHCTSYSDDRQVMQFLGDRLEEKGYRVIYGAADHIRFKEGEAYSILDGNEGKVDGIFRFTPLEWLTEIKPKKWQGYFDTKTPSCNHPVAIFAQTKRFPLIWDTLSEKGLDFSTWRELLPDTGEVKKAKGMAGYIYKPACGRVGEKISIKEACKGNEYKKILAEVRRHPKRYLAQKQFESMPLSGEKGEKFHVCLGSYAVDGKHGGYYARISNLPRIDSYAADIPVLIENGQMPLMTHGLFEKIPENENSIEAKQLYEIWAPRKKRWTGWVRCVPFLMEEKNGGTYCEQPFYHKQTKVSYIENSKKDTAIIVDLPGAESVLEGLKLAKTGFRPIPLFNGTQRQKGSRATVDNEAIKRALKEGAEELLSADIEDDAAPAFLLDRNRLQRYKIDVTVFDNSWDIYHQDLPSAEYMIQCGIKKIIVVGTDVARDLKKILYEHQKKGIVIYHTNRYETPKKAVLSKPVFERERGI